jgi:hypothetical protein
MAVAGGAPSLPALGRGCWEDGAISLGLVAVQLGGAAYMVVVTPVLALGLDPLFLVAVGSLCTGVLTLPFAVKLERYGGATVRAHAINPYIYAPSCPAFLINDFSHLRHGGAGRNGRLR